MTAVATGVDDRSGVPKKTPLILFWALCTTLWSIFRPPKCTYAARILLFQPAWAFRIVQADPSWTQDLTLCLSLHFVHSWWAGHWTLPGLDDFQWLDPNGKTFVIYCQVFSLLAVCGVFAGGIVFRGHGLSRGAEDDRIGTQRIDDQVLPPLMITSRTTHSRLFPKKHAFSYSYLYVGVPVGTQGKINRLLSVDTQQPAWFHVDSADYLERGHADQTLAAKLKSYLHTQGVTDRDYAFAYLATAPRFLGYSFNPVSFWYLYDSDTKLKYMILEVNNTFDERRIYLLRGSTKASDELDQQPPAATSSNVRASSPQKPRLFTEMWPKDFHVSPFNSREGSYSLKALDPLAAYESAGHVRIDNTIVLRSSKGHAKIVARVFSEGEPKHPSSVSALETALFIAQWFWVGLATFPRIVYEAGRLFFRRKLHVWYRPEVTTTSIARPITSEETHLEVCFRSYLTEIVHRTAKPLRVIYEPVHSEGTEIVLYSPGYTYEEAHQRTLTLKVVSPAFYARIVHYTSVQEGIEKEALARDGKNRTASLDRTDLLDDLFSNPESHNSITNPLTRLDPLERLKWGFLQRLRCQPPPVSYPEQQHLTPPKPSPASQLSDLDVHVLDNCDAADTSAYRRILTELFLAQRFALGMPVVLTLLDVFVRAVMLLASMIFSDRSAVMDVLRRQRLGVEDAGTVVVTLMLANAIHVWRWIKG